MELEAITCKICKIAEDTASFILEERKQFDSSKVEEKSTNSLVSYVDKNAELRIVEGLSKLIPNAGFIGEEGTSDRKGTEYNWIIDPLDGTTNFIHGVPCFAVSIGLQRGDEIVAGCITEVNLKENFYAWKDGGAFLNGKRIHVSKTSEVKNALLATGFPYYAYEKLDEYLQLFRYLLKHCRGVRRPGSAATDLAYAACGRFDGFYEYSLKPWDVAAGIVLMKEAGGRVSDFSGGDNYLFGEEIIVGNNLLFDELLCIIKKFMD